MKAYTKKLDEHVRRVVRYLNVARKAGATLAEVADKAFTGGFEPTRKEIAASLRRNARAGGLAVVARRWHWRSKRRPSPAQVEAWCRAQDAAGKGAGARARAMFGGGR